jgi:hypothetical protein
MTFTARLSDLRLISTWALRRSSLAVIICSTVCKVFGDSEDASGALSYRLHVHVFHRSA